MCSGKVPPGSIWGALPPELLDELKADKIQLAQSSIVVDGPFNFQIVCALSAARFLLWVAVAFRAIFLCSQQDFHGDSIVCAKLAVRMEKDFAQWHCVLSNLDGASLELLARQEGVRVKDVKPKRIRRKILQKWSWGLTSHFLRRTFSFARPRPQNVQMLDQRQGGCNRTV